MYDGFSGQSRRAIQLASAEARRQGKDYLGTEHLLAGIVREESGAVVGLFTSRGIYFLALADATDRLDPSATGSANKEDVPLPLTPSVQRVLDHARAEAAALKHSTVGVEHLLLGLARDPDSLAGQALRGLPLDLDQFCQDIRQQPAQDNRDSMLTETPTRAAVRDPSPTDLAVLVTPKPIPRRIDEPAATADDSAATYGAEEYRQLYDAYVHLEGTRRQLRVTQCVIGACLGAIAAASPSFDSNTLRGILVGGLLGLAFAFVRNGLIAALLILALAYKCWNTFVNPPDSLPFVMSAAGIALALCLGDWPRLRAWSRNVIR